MLEEAVAQARAGEAETDEESDWSPQISAGMPVLIPESYVRDLGVRMGLYKRLAEVQEPDEIDGFAAELADRFGPLPPEVENLLEIIAIKVLCRKANVENNRFPNPAGLVTFIAQNRGAAKLRPDQKIVCIRDWETPKDRIRGMRKLMTKIAHIAVENQNDVKTS